MLSNVFSQFKMPILNYEITAERDDHGLAVLSFRAPGAGLRRLHLDGASQLRQQLEFAGEHENAAEISRLIERARRLGQ